MFACLFQVWHMFFLQTYPRYEEDILYLILFYMFDTLYISILLHQVTFLRCFNFRINVQNDIKVKYHSHSYDFNTLDLWLQVPSISRMPNYFIFHKYEKFGLHFALNLLNFPTR